MKFNVYAVVNGKPIAIQNEKPLSRNRAKVLAENLEYGKTKATRVTVTPVAERVSGAAS